MKKSLVISTIATVLVVVVALTTATFAWFSTSSETSVQSSFTIGGTSSPVTIARWLPAEGATAGAYEGPLFTEWNLGTADSADYEFVKYPNARFQHGEDGYGYYDFEAENADIEAYLRPTHNFRAGAEFRVNSIASLRAGYSFRDSPYHETNKKHNRLQAQSAGAGLNFGSFYCDAAYVYKVAKNETVFYSYIDPNTELNDVIATPVSNKYINHEIRLSLGIRF